MADQFGRAGRRADLARLFHTTLVEQGLAPLDGSARAAIDSRIAEVAANLGVSEPVALKHFRDEDVIVLARNTAGHWHAADAVEDAAGGVKVTVPADAVAQLVMGLAMAVGQMVREVYGELPASAGQPLDALCELGAALRDAYQDSPPITQTTLQTLTIAHRALKGAADGVADGSISVVVAEAARPALAKQLYEDAQLARDLQP